MEEIIFLEGPFVTWRELKRIIGLQFSDIQSAMAILKEIYPPALIRVLDPITKPLYDESGQLCCLIVEWPIIETDTGAHVLTLSKIKDLNIKTSLGLLCAKCICKKCPCECGSHRPVWINPEAHQRFVENMFALDRSPC